MKSCLFRRREESVAGVGPLFPSRHSFFPVVKEISSVVLLLDPLVPIDKDFPEFRAFRGGGLAFHHRETPDPGGFPDLLFSFNIPFF